MDALVSIMAIWFDRLRGSGLERTKALFQVLLAVSVAILIDVPLNWIFFVFVALFVAGSAPGWGNPVSAYLKGIPMKNDYESWQVGILRRNVHLAMIARGLIWALPVMVLLPWHQLVWTVTVAYAVAFPLAAVIARQIHRTHANGQCTWGHMEWTRGVLAMSTINALML